MEPELAARRGAREDDCVSGAFSVVSGAGSRKRIEMAVGSFLRRHRANWILALAAGVFLAGVGAFGTGAAPMRLLYPYWLCVMLLGAAIGSVSVDLFHVRGWLEERTWLKGAALTFVISAPQTVVVWAISNAVFDDPWRPAGLVSLLPAVLLVSAAFVTLHLVLGREPALTRAVESPTPVQPRFFERLPLRLRGAELYAVQADDHYLRLHTSRGSHLILMRLADAVEELAGVEGAQTHRSWWVAKDAVLDAVCARGRAELTLKGGARVPVSRTYTPALRRDRWF